MDTPLHLAQQPGRQPQRVLGVAPPATRHHVTVTVVSPPDRIDQRPVALTRSRLQPPRQRPVLPCTQFPRLPLQIGPQRDHVHDPRHVPPYPQRRGQHVAGLGRMTITFSTFANRWIVTGLRRLPRRGLSSNPATEAGMAIAYPVSVPAPPARPAVVVRIRDRRARRDDRRIIAGAHRKSSG